MRAGRSAREPRWVPRRQLIAARLPSRARSWLFEPHSLTRRIQGACPGCFRVRVLSQRHERPMLNERRLLGIPDHALAVVRQVQLLCNDRPWVYGRTVIPLATLTGAQRRLSSLGSRSLGAMLFADSSLKRFEVQVAQILPWHDLYGAATFDLPRGPAAVWGRRSVFRTGDKPLLVSEVFLPPVLGEGGEDSDGGEHLLV